MIRKVTVMSPGKFMSGSLHPKALMVLPVWGWVVCHSRLSPRYAILYSLMVRLGCTLILLAVMYIGCNPLVSRVDVPTLTDVKWVAMVIIGGVVRRIWVAVVHRVDSRLFHKTCINFLQMGRGIYGLVKVRYFSLYQSTAEQGR